MYPVSQSISTFQIVTCTIYESVSVFTLDPSSYASFSKEIYMAWANRNGEMALEMANEIFIHFQI